MDVATRHLDCRLPKARRLTRRSDFERVYGCRQRAVGRFLVLWRAPGTASGVRAGVVASRRVGGAVQRNRAKRRLREAFRIVRARLTSPADIILTARAAILAARWEELTDDLEAAAARAGLLPALPAAAGRGADVGVPGARQAATGDQVSLS